ncbi:MAG: hypothetical protein KGI27_06245 [Thaumarchaeota archaeon]|nr:hypothetical protein [Nitrososphaerota archaeon]
MNRITPREIILTIISVILAGITGYIVNWNVSTLIANQTVIAYFLLGGIIASLVYGWKPRLERFFEKHENHEKKELYKKIHEELKDAIESLDNTLERDTYKVEVQGKEIYWKHIFMNHAVYDSSIYSGDFNQIDHKLQQPIQDIYGKINLHYQGVKKIVDDRENAVEQAPILDGYEKELRKDIPTVMNELKKYFQ